MTYKADAGLYLGKYSNKETYNEVELNLYENPMKVQKGASRIRGMGADSTFRSNFFSNILRTQIDLG